MTDMYVTGETVISDAEHAEHVAEQLSNTDSLKLIHDVDACKYLIVEVV